MSTENTFDGWNNRETYFASLWLNNDSGFYHHYRNIYIYHREKGLDIEKAIEKTSRLFENEIKNYAPDIKSSLYSDLLTSALTNINYYEIIKELCSDLEN